jgi:DNA-binding transcriptional MocR family regulator
MQYLFEVIPKQYERKLKEDSYFGVPATLRRMEEIRIGDFHGDYGISRSTKNRAMRELEESGILQPYGCQWITTRRFVAKVLRIHSGYYEKNNVDDLAWLKSDRKKG